ncbi:MAG: fused DSP-PTPase phosphatase/NAD kinase-like protein [Planctomycetota bacterium]
MQRRKTQILKRSTLVYICIILLIIAICLIGTHSYSNQTGTTGKAALVDLIKVENPARALELPGLGNCYKVSENLYRGAQPTREGFRQLKALGIKTVINLRSFHSDRDDISGIGLAYEHIYMKAWHAEAKEIIRFLKIVTDPNKTPVFVHCQHGADRTGTMCAIYRIAVEGWPKEKAIEEMTEGPYGFHEIWSNLINYITNLDVEQIKASAGLTEKISPDKKGKITN